LPFIELILEESMSYQVLARKWRPHTFEELVGQEHVLRALQNALEQNRLHHAYLFTGTRGVGKTTIARILAKCLNCETGITATPCGKCSACQEIDAGTFIDLIEVDAASRTKVEDTRELLDNVQYSPTRGRFKIYLIDEVHMLSGHSFNALLKTLEEPPEHVKFLLATTDPQKLPVTILSRCLQFNLKHLSTDKIDQYLQTVLQAEKIPFEKPAIHQIARAANGSIRDSLSLLDQAIAYTQHNLQTAEVTQMLGTVEQTFINALLKALATSDGKQLLEIAAQLAEYDADFGHVLDELCSALHQIAIHQIVPDAPIREFDQQTMIQELSPQIGKEDIQLYYQIALLGRRDLAHAHEPRDSFEMTLLRMLAFQPISETSLAKETAPIKQTPKTAPITQATQNKTASTHEHAVQTKDWATLLANLQLTGMVYALASHCSLSAIQENQIELILSPNHAALLNNKLQARLNEALNQYFGKKMKLSIQAGQAKAETPADKKQREATEQHQEAIASIENDPHVQELINKLGVNIDPALISAT